MPERTDRTELLELTDALNRLHARMARLEEAVVSNTKMMADYIQIMSRTYGEILEARRRPWWRR